MKMDQHSSSTSSSSSFQTSNLHDLWYEAIELIMVINHQDNQQQTLENKINPEREINSIHEALYIFDQIYRSHQENHSQSQYTSKSKLKFNMGMLHLLLMFSIVKNQPTSIEQKSLLLPSFSRNLTIPSTIDTNSRTRATKPILTNISDMQSSLIQESIHSFSFAIQIDPYFALAYFARAFCYFLQENYEKAFLDYKQSLKLLQDNPFINYIQLGLNFILYRCEIHYNLAVCYLKLKILNQNEKKYNQWASDQLVKAYQSSRETGVHLHEEIIGKASKINHSTLTDDQQSFIFMVPRYLLFMPRHSSYGNLRSLERRHYLKKASIILQ